MQTETEECPEAGSIYAGTIRGNKFHIRNKFVELQFRVELDEIVEDSCPVEGQKPFCVVSIPTWAVGEDDRRQVQADLEALDLEVYDLERFHPDHPEPEALYAMGVFVQQSDVTDDESWHFVPIRTVLDLEDLRENVSHLASQLD